MPLFGLPTIASALNTAVNLYGQRILMAMLDGPEAAQHDLRVINDLLCTLHRWHPERLPLDQIQPVVDRAPHRRGRGCPDPLMCVRMTASLRRPSLGGKAMLARRQVMHRASDEPSVERDHSSGRHG